MAEVFRVQLVSLDVSAMTEGGAPSLLHAEAHMHGRGAMHEDTDAHDDTASSPVELLSKLYYGAASIVSEVEDGCVLSERQTAAVQQRCQSPAHMDLQGGSRLFLFHPVEEGEFLLAVTIPVGVWRWLGPVALHVVLSTAVRGYEISTHVAAVTSVPTYYPLRDRLAENAPAVQDAVRERMKQLIEFVNFLNECGHRETASAAALRQGGQEAVAAAQKMCYERPSSIRTSNRLSMTLQQLLWSATSSSDYIALSGTMPSGGMCDGYKRLIVTAAAVWHLGEPLFSNSSREDFEAHLLPAAIVAYAEQCSAGRRADATLQPVTVKCLAMHSQTGRDAVRTAGYVKHSQQNEQRAIVCVVFVSSGGWIIVLCLEAALNVFTGSPMPHIVSGVTNLITMTLETPRFADVVREFTACNLLVARPSAALTAPVHRVLQAVRHLGLFTHCPTSTAYATAVSRDTCLYRYRRETQDAVVGVWWVPWPEHMSKAVLPLVKLASVAFRYRRQKGYCGSSSSSSIRVTHGLTSFSLLRGRDAVVVLVAAPVFDLEPRVVSFLAEMDPKGLPAVAELRAFAMWVLSKAV
ncbi:kinesin [Trypanosoma grayi]|uniref:kinesin n=1 Tax=Trypanosoma grayi TaxID=71804 RepID=UPI0004F443C7|nr:kinesin [Trypanosoma grayi]KEG11546.1 kinesin [Trypanosoma grayi]